MRVKTFPSSLKKPVYYANPSELEQIKRNLYRLFEYCKITNQLPYSGLCDSILLYSNVIVSTLFSQTFAPNRYDEVLGSRLYWGHGDYTGSIYYEFTPMRESLLLLFIESLPDLVIIKNLPS